MRLALIPVTLTTVAGAVLACSSDTPSGNNPPPASGNVTLQPVTNLSLPIFLTAPPGDTGRLFILEKDGWIRIVQHGVLLPDPFLDITAKTSKGDEQGLLGMAFYPDYATSGRFIVSYTSPQGLLSGGTSVLSRYHVSSDSNLADTTETVLLRFDQPYENHNGGMVAFGADGYLYAGFGDGGSAGDPQSHGQDRTDLLGSLLRLDVSGAGDYAIPPSNPYASSLTFAQELWDYGLRNPWRFSFDRLTHDLYIADVGQASREEIDVAPASSAGGENYGWNITEGTICYIAATCNTAGITPPVLDYDHSQGCAIIGGYVYRGADIPALRGLYFYSDNCGGWVRSFRLQAGQAMDNSDWPDLNTGDAVMSFGEDARGELYVMVASGPIYKIVPQ